jgi:hypothetical protein
MVRWEPGRELSATQRRRARLTGALVGAVLVVLMFVGWWYFLVGLATTVGVTAAYVDRTRRTRR